MMPQGTVSSARLPGGWRILVILVVLFIGAQGIYSMKSLYADGAYFLLMVITSGKFLLMPARELAGIATQLPLLSGLHVGVVEIDALARLFGLGLIGVPILLWTYALYMHRYSLFFWPFVLAFSWIYLPSGFFAIGEYNVAYALVAAAAAILMVPTITLGNGIVLCIVALIGTRSYELMVAAGPLLALGCIGRLRAGGSKTGVGARWLIGFSAGLFILSAPFALFSILYPRDPATLVDATRGPALLFSSQILYVSSLTFLALVASLNRRPRWLGAVLVGIGAMLATAYLTVDALRVYPSLSYPLRTALIMPMSAGLFFVVIHCFSPGLKDWALFSEFHSAKTLVLIVFMTLAANFISDNYFFGRMVSAYRTELASLSVSTSVSHTSLDWNPSYRRYLWDWCNPVMSQLLGDGRVIIENSPEYHGWEPDLTDLIQKNLFAPFRSPLKFPVSDQPRLSQHTPVHPSGITSPH